MRFVPFPGPSSSGNEVLGKCTVPGGPCVLITSPVPTAWFPRCTARASSQVCRVSPPGSWSQAVTLLADVSRPESQEEVVSNREPDHTSVEDAGLWSWDCLLPSGSGCHMPVSLPPAGVGAGRGLYAARLARLCYSPNPLSCEWVRLHFRAFCREVLFFFPLWRSHSLGCYPTLAPSDCLQGIQAPSLP